MIPNLSGCEIYDSAQQEESNVRKVTVFSQLLVKGEVSVIKKLTAKQKWPLFVGCSQSELIGCINGMYPMSRETFYGVEWCRISFRS
jgi:hypothetical protein